ncbi:hypothetical protein TNCV_236011 [Trichonephila clavipes]|nr:hypothetical protein TNCV_236011 [Trichonephila clavipes]
MPREGALHHIIIVPYPKQNKRLKGNGCDIQHDFMLLTVRELLRIVGIGGSELWRQPRPVTGCYAYKEEVVSLTF